jgi:hypothetical protein
VHEIRIFLYDKIHIMKNAENPVNLIAALIRDGRHSVADPDVSHALSLALQRLSFCGDTMALLVQAIGVGQDEDYKEIRAVFDSHNS